jgi:hypothetical protein
MSTLSKVLVAVALSAAAVGCAGAQTNTEVAAHGTVRTDAGPHGGHEAAPQKGHEFWQKMR